MSVTTLQHHLGLPVTDTPVCDPNAMFLNTSSVSFKLQISDQIVLFTFIRTPWMSPLESIPSPFCSAKSIVLTADRLIYLFPAENLCQRVFVGPLTAGSHYPQGWYHSQGWSFPPNLCACSVVSCGHLAICPKRSRFVGNQQMIQLHLGLSPSCDYLPGANQPTFRFTRRGACAHAGRLFPFPCCLVFVDAEEHIGGCLNR